MNSKIKIKYHIQQYAAIHFSETLFMELVSLINDRLYLGYHIKTESLSTFDLFAAAL